MSAFDKIIGYEDIKKKLACTADVLANPQAYSKLGVRAPRAMLLYGDPGVGKTLMAQCLIKESGRASVICRKNEPNGEFVKVIKKKFAEAEKLAPSILLLDDLDKFANADRCDSDAEEYVTVQSCLDELEQAGSEVFVLATVNNIQYLSRSLRRSGRLGNKIKVRCPSGKDAELVLSYYLSKKRVVEDIDPQFLARMMGGHSCAELAEVVNTAGLLAGYERSETIAMEHLMKAMLQALHNVPETMTNGADSLSAAALSNRERTAVHEAGHVVISEALLAESVTFACVYSVDDSETDGFSSSCLAEEYNVLKRQQIDILNSLGSRAALEQRYGIIDGGAEKDLAEAFKQMKGLVGNTCSCGFTLFSYGYDDSETLKERIEQTTASEVERYYRKAKEILLLNAEFLDAIADALFEKGMLTMHDIAEIRKTCKVVGVAL